ncbi:MAG: adenylyltransferase/cytidyltransferase family protein [Anaerolineales bacterium]|uniref:Adenylyltransferase/cytidyltransferase family protein n=1 Tax=Candidatus Desulfolinea nitratireducens TaxID=2841698 RepID=A0A8J6NM94_9CHLR|nr:adenylyltransferase/cytidyltransferase family protein [Candidatus Desulfolinea nitratireducens]MBL6960331.1 adenylyltransferase/cytidyltransferase family protein [Anaerolineales bacterium]
MVKPLVAILGRWQPCHLGHRAAIHALCDRFDHVLIGIGSSNIINYRNPFSLEETIEMLQLGLEGYDNFRLVPIPDSRDEIKWCSYVEEVFGDLDLLITANPYVRSLLDHRYQISHPAKFIPRENQIPVSGTIVRRKMAQGNGWEELLPAEISKYLIENQLDQRFRREFGLSNLALDTIVVE